MSKSYIKTIEQMLEKAVNDGVVSCPKCEYESCLSFWFSLL